MNQVVGLGDAFQEDVLQHFDGEGAGKADKKDFIPFDGGIDAGEDNMRRMDLPALQRPQILLVQVVVLFHKDHIGEDQKCGDRHQIDPVPERLIGNQIDHNQ